MEVIPAIDLRDGKCVRLIQGQYHRQITYEDDPVKQARQFVQAGAKWLHIVDLDGARVGELINAETIKLIAKAADLSFNCIRCGLCALRCPAEIVQYNAAILARRLTGKYLLPKSPDLEERVKEIAEGLYEKELQKLTKSDTETVKKRYYERDIKTG